MPAPRGVVPVVQATYARHYRTLWERHWWWRSRESFVLGWVEQLHRRSPRRRILDVGCGDGLFFDRLSRFGSVEGLEADDGLLTDSPWRPRIRVGTLGDGFRPEAPYDLVLMLDVLEHIEDDNGALESVRELLRPGGHLLLTVPALSWLWSRHDEANHHFRRYARAGLGRLLKHNGFSVENLRYFFAWTVAPLVARRLLAPAGGSPGQADYEVAIPPEPLNACLTLASRAEHAIGRVVPWPLGSSLLAVARRDS